ncbi:MAG: hypothetical protein WCS52_06795 [bacterium]
MVWLLRILLIWCLVSGLTGCRTRQRVPDYLPREVIANQVGNAVVYEIADPRRTEGHASLTSGVPASTLSSGPTVGSPVADSAIKRKTLYGQPEGVTVSSKGLREVMVSWKMPTDECFHYKIERSFESDDAFAEIAAVSPRKMSFKDTGTRDNPLRDNTAYYYRIIAQLEREGPESIPSAVVKAVTAPPPASPSKVSTVASSSRGVTVTWGGAAPSEAVTLYRVERALASSSTAFERIGVTPSCTFTDGGTAASVLKDSTRYLYRVVAVNRVNAESAPSGVSEVVTLPPPAAVKHVVGVSDEVRCVPISWESNPEPDVVRYDVYRARQAEGLFEKIGSAPGRSSCSYLDGGTNPGKLEDEAIYFYRIRAVNAVTAEGAFSDVARAFTRGVPEEVAAVVALTGRPREIPVSWTMSLDKSVVGYEVWRADDSEDNWAQVCRLNGHSSTNFLDRGEIKPTSGLGFLKDGAVYQYKVIGFNNANVRSSASIAASARTKYRPAAPVGLMATTNTPLSINLTWAANSEMDIADYVVESADRPDAGFRKLMTVASGRLGGLSAREMALESGTIRYSRIKAVDKAGLESDWSKVIMGRAKPIPDAPSRVSREWVGTNARVSWQAPAQPDVQRYNVWRKKLFGWEPIATTEQTSYLFEFTELSKPMTVTISAVDKDGLESEKSGMIEIEPGK